VWRWAVARRVAMQLLRGESPRSGVQVTQEGRVQTVRVSAARGGAAAVKMIATPRSKVTRV
jgi:hypothetical protein